MPNAKLSSWDNDQIIHKIPSMSIEFSKRPMASFFSAGLWGGGVIACSISFIPHLWCNSIHS